MPLENHRLHGPVEDRLIDRLVDGELPDAERRALLLQLETEPDGWRRCALAFLEAQSWRETFRPLAAPAREEALPVVPQPRRSRKPHSWRPVARLTGLAASLAMAFALGWGLHSGPVENASDAPLARREPAAPAGPEESPQPASQDVAAAPSQPPDLGEPPALRDPVIQQWEQRGYRAERQSRRISMELQDGRRLEVPVQELRIRYVGDRTY
jgi:hypothetical protein